MKVRKRKKLTINPFVSEAQRRACYAADDPDWDCEEWETHTPKGKKLPKRKGKATSNAARRYSPSRVDPTRTVTLRRAFSAQLRRKFAILKGRLVKLLVDEDALGLKEREHDAFALHPSLNSFCPTGEGGGVDPSCSPGDKYDEWGRQQDKERSDRYRQDAKDRLQLAQHDYGQHDIPHRGVHVAEKLGNDPKRAASAVRSDRVAWHGIDAKELEARVKVLAKNDVKDLKKLAASRMRDLVSHQEQGAHLYRAETKEVAASAPEPQQRAYAKMVAQHEDRERHISASHDAVLAALRRMGVNVENVSPYPSLSVTLNLDPLGDYWQDEGGAQYVVNYDPDQPRDERGRFASGGSSSPATAAQPPPSLLSRLKGVGAKLSSLTDRIPVLGKIKGKVAQGMKAIHGKLEARYGAKVATAIMTSGSIGGYGVMALSTMTMGFPGIPIVNDLISIAAHTAVAELGLQAGRIAKRITGNEEITADWHHSAALALTQEEWSKLLHSLVREHYEDVRRSLRGNATLLQEAAGLTGHEPVVNTRWAFSADPEKVRAFKQWLVKQSHDLLQSQSDREMWQRYVEQGFRRGAARSFDDVNRGRRVLSQESQQKLDFYAGTRDQFLRSSFHQPESVEKVRMLASRSFDEMENVTTDMATRMTRTLTDGLVQGQHPTEIARSLADDLDISSSRAETIARTEVIRAHAEGQLTAMEQMGVEEVGVMVEWSTAGDDKVCPACEPLEGVVLKLEEAAGMIPRHPRCRCAWVPANVGEDDEDQQRSARSIRRAVAASAEELGDDLEIEVSTTRPRSTL